jgi:predicted lipase
MAGFGLLIDPLAVGQDGLVTALVTFFRGHKLDSAMAMLMVVALKKLLHPGTRLFQAGKPSLWVGRMVLTGAK